MVYAADLDVIIEDELLHDDLVPAEGHPPVK